MIGTTLSHYRITAKLGEGGMGEVYLAEDSELDRKVALKVLPQKMAEDPERLERFKREAKAVAALNHPNIVTIHSIEEAGGRRFLTMELVEGDSLDRVIPAEGLPLPKIFDIAVPISEALTAAHEKGIVHRDLKPANVMVMPDGRVKVLDFGLAKIAMASAPPPEGRCHRSRSHRRRHGHGHGSLHVPGTTPRPSGRSPDRHLLVGNPPLRDGDRSAPVPG